MRLLKIVPDDTNIDFVRLRYWAFGLTTLLTIAAGFRIGDFGGPADPLALRWRGLPAHPAELLAGGLRIRCDLPEQGRA